MEYWENEEDYFSELLHNGKKSYSVTDIENIIASLIEKVNLAGLISAGEELEKILESVKSGNETPANAFLKKCTDTPPNSVISIITCTPMNSVFCPRKTTGIFLSVSLFFVTFLR